MSEPSIRKIKIPLTPSGQKLPKKTKKRHSETTTNISVICDLARFMQKKYKILPAWKGESIELLELCKTRSESKCLLELFTQSKKAVKKASKTATNEPTTKTSKSSKTGKKPLFTSKMVKRRSGSNKTQKVVEKEKKDEENTITEIAQRSK